MSNDLYRIMVEGPDKQFAQRVAWMLYLLMKESGNNNIQIPYEIEDQSLLTPHEQIDLISKMGEHPFLFDAKQSQVIVVTKESSVPGKCDFSTTTVDEISEDSATTLADFGVEEGKLVMKTPGELSNDSGLTSYQLSNKYNPFGNEHPGYPLCEWKKHLYFRTIQITDYWEWVAYAIAIEKPTLANPPNEETPKFDIRNLFARIFRRLLQERPVSEFEKSIDEYLSSNIQESAKVSVKGNLNKELLRPSMTWKIFLKALYLFKVKHVKVEMTFTMLTGKELKIVDQIRLDEIDSSTETTEEV